MRKPLSLKNIKKSVYSHNKTQPPSADWAITPTLSFKKNGSSKKSWVMHPPIPPKNGILSHERCLP